MGIITSIYEELDREEQAARVYIITSGNVSTRAALNRVAGRAAVYKGMGQRDLVAAAYDKLGIDLVWNDGPFSTLLPEEKFPDAKKINYQFWEVESMGQPLGFFPPSLKDKLQFDVLRGNEYLHMWEVPFEVMNR